MVSFWANLSKIVRLFTRNFWSHRFHWPKLMLFYRANVGDAFSWEYRCMSSWFRRRRRCRRRRRRRLGFVNRNFEWASICATSSLGKKSTHYFDNWVVKKTKVTCYGQGVPKAPSFSTWCSNNFSIINNGEVIIPRSVSIVIFIFKRST